MYILWVSRLAMIDHCLCHCHGPIPFSYITHTAYYWSMLHKSTLHGDVSVSKTTSSEAFLRLLNRNARSWSLTHFRDGCQSTPKQYSQSHSIIRVGYLACCDLTPRLARHTPATKIYCLSGRALNSSLKMRSGLMIPVLVRRGECDGLRRYCGEPSCVYAKLVSNVNMSRNKIYTCIGQPGYAQIHKSTCTIRTSRKCDLICL